MPNLHNPKEGWKPWYVFYRDVGPFSLGPYTYEEVEIFRSDWEQSQRVYPCRLDPAMNIQGLYWRPIRQQDDWDAAFRDLWHRERSDG